VGLGFGNSGVSQITVPVICKNNFITTCAYFKSVSSFLINLLCTDQFLLHFYFKLVVAHGHENKTISNFVTDEYFFQLIDTIFTHIDLRQRRKKSNMGYVEMIV
jgi:hypothetical protein